MKKYFIVLIAAACLLAGCTGNQGNNQPAEDALNEEQQNIVISQSVDTYFIDGTLENNNTFTATQRVNYVNKEQQALSEIYFHLYPNMYQDETMFTDGMSTDFPNGFNKGGIELEEVSILGIPLSTELSDENKLLKINLSTPLAPMESLVITFKYKTTLPQGHSRMSYAGDSINLTGFYPMAAVYDGGWKTDEYNNIGDPFFTDMADFYITLRLPSGYTVASTGQHSSKEENGAQEVTITASHVREAAIVVNPALKLYEEMVDGISIRSYAADETYGRLALTYAKDAVAFYNAAYGKYPYSQLSIVESVMHGGGMEYPNLVLISEEYYVAGEEINLEWIVAHEVAHQWWYGLVGSDPINDPFLDESLTEFSTLLYARNKYDEATYNKLKNNFILSPYSYYKVLLTDGTIHKNIMEYETSLELSLLVYIRGCMMYMDMEEIMGEEKLKQVLSSYYQAHAYSIVSDEEWKNHIKSSHDYNWDAFFNKWLYSETAGN